MGNKLNRESPQYPTPEIVHNKPNNFDDKCYKCRGSGEIKVSRKYDQGHICKTCLTKIFQIHCSECETNELEYNLHRDIDRLEIVCRNCGLVLAGIIVEVDNEKDDYRTNKPLDYNELEDDPDNDFYIKDLEYIPKIKNDLWPCDPMDLQYNLKRKYK